MQIETLQRVFHSQRPGYQPHGQNRALAPWSREQNSALDEWNYIPPRHHDHDEDFNVDEEPDDYWSDERDINDFEDLTKSDYQIFGPAS